MTDYDGSEIDEVVEPEPRPAVGEELTRSEVLNRFGPEVGQLLLDGGYFTIDSIMSATDKELEAIPDLGRATVKKIRELLAPPPVAPVQPEENVSVRVQRIRDSQQ